jgi:hypothetical protein
MSEKGKTAKKPVGRTWSHHIDVIGLGFRWKRDGRRALADMIEKRGSITGIRIVREPDNRHDENALAVLLPPRILDGAQLGYIRATTAEQLAPRIDDKTLRVCAVTLLSLDEDDEWRSGELHVRFLDVKPKPAKGKKTAKRKDAKRDGTARKRAGQTAKT